MSKITKDKNLENSAMALDLKNVKASINARITQLQKEQAELQIFKTAIAIENPKTFIGKKMQLDLYTAVAKQVNAYHDNIIDEIMRLERVQ